MPPHRMGWRIPSSSVMRVLNSGARISNQLVPRRDCGSVIAPIASSGMAGEFAEVGRWSALPERLPTGELVRQCWCTVRPGGPVLQLWLAGALEHIRGVPVFFRAAHEVPATIPALIRIEIADC